MAEPMKNTYLDQVMEQQQKLEVDLRAKRHSSMPAAAQRMVAPNAPQGPKDDDTGGHRRAVPAAAQPAGNAVDVRISGFLRWRNVLVPPNAYVVHTRRGRTEPLHIGLGISFRYNPYTDSFLVVPGAMQTILINAYCICKELQGLLVQGYVQWIVADFATAYKKLDFSDVEDPMRVVNVQLREQAEAAIKDKVATMGIDEVLSDKQPIIEELTSRLRHVAEGVGGTDKGLGLRIVTVQIKEAVVSSTRVWENLQKPFRAERERIARLAQLEAESVIQARERDHEKTRQTAELENQGAIDALRSQKEAETFDREQAEHTRRHQKEQEGQRQAAKEANETALQAAALEKIRQEKEAEVQRAKLAESLAQQKIAGDGQIALEDARRAAANRQVEKDIGFLEARQKIQNALSDHNLQARLLEVLPTVAEKLPKPNELKSVTFAGGAGAQEGQALSSLVATVMTVMDTFRDGKENGKAKPAKG